MRFIIILICTYFVSCNPVVAKKNDFTKSNAVSINELFLRLPNEAFFINENQPIISKSERQTILKATTQKQAVTLSSNFMVDTSKASPSFLKFDSFANDEGISVSLKTWKLKDNSIIIGVNITTSDMCCEYSKLKLFHYKKATFNEVTKNIFPELKIEDFVSEVKTSIKEALPYPIEIVIYLHPNKDFIELSIDDTPMLYNLEDIESKGKVKFLWNKEKFLIPKK